MGFITFGVTAQNLTQTIRGIITDKVSEKPLAGVTVLIDKTSLSAISDAEGKFVISNVPASRIRLNIFSVGYQPASIPEILVTTGKEVILEIALEQRISSLDEVVVKSSRTKKGAVSNEYAGSSARSFSIDEVTRYAGGRNDPSKLVSNFAGVISNNDSRNDIVVRGNSPASVLWRIEGLPAPNPNHFSTLGTTGGPVSILNTNALKTSDFYTGAFSSEFGNASAAVFDISLRNGNTQKHERTVQLNAFSGLEALLEGPLSKNKNGSSYLFGYRYSFAQIGQSIGLNLGTEAVPKYQDWVFNIQFAKTKMGKLSFYGMGGISSIDFIGKDIDTTDFYSRKDQDTYVKSNLLLFGLKHTLDIGSKSFIRTSVSYSDVTSKLNSYQYKIPFQSYENRWLITRIDDKQNVARFSSIFNRKSSSSFSWRTGITGEFFNLKTDVKDRDGKGETAPFDQLRNFDDRFALFQYFVQAKYKPTEKLTFIAGLHGMNFSLNNKNIIEPRASIQYQPDGKNTLSISYGLHGQIQPFPVYFYQKQNAIPDQSNKNLDFSKAQHYIFGYENRFAPDWRIKTEFYYQYLYDVPVESVSSGFSMLNAGSDFTFPEKGGLVNNGTGNNRGIEITLEKFLSKGYYLLTTGSVYKSTYEGSDKVTRNTTYNNKYAANILAGGEWKLGKNKSKSFTVDVRMATIGGRYATPVNLAQSILQGKEVLDENNYNGVQLENYFRLDTKFGFRINSKKRKISQTFYLDLQNVTNKENVFLRRYNPVYGTVGQVNQIGFFPDILYKLQF